MIHTIEGTLNGKGYRFAVIVTRTESELEQALYQETIDTLLTNGAEDGCITAIRVPTVWELPLALKKIACIDEYDAVIVLGVHPGKEESSHGLEEIRIGLGDISLEAAKPVAFTITGKTDKEKLRSKGEGAVLRVLEMATLLTRIHDHEIEYKSRHVV